MTHTSKTWSATIAAALAVVTILGTVPGAAFAQGNRQKTKNEWRNLAIAAGGLAAFGFIKKDPTIGFVGAAGALYSLNRYEQDRKSQDKNARARANIFNQSSFYRDGKRYDRRVVSKNGQKYYQFVRH